VGGNCRSHLYFWKEEGLYFYITSKIRVATRRLNCRGTCEVRHVTLRNGAVRDVEKGRRQARETRGMRGKHGGNDAVLCNKGDLRAGPIPGEALGEKVARGLRRRGKRGNRRCWPQPEDMKIHSGPGKVIREGCGGDFKLPSLLHPAKKTKEIHQTPEKAH